MNSQLNIIQYTEKSFVVRGNTTENKEQLKNIGGKYNALLKGGPGWIFPNFLKKNVEEYVKSGSITNSSFSSKEDKEEKKEYKKDYINKNNTHDTHESSLTKRVETLEEQIKLLMNKLGLEKDKNNSNNSTKKKKDVEPDEEEEEDGDEPDEEVEIPRKSFLTKNKK